MQIHGSDMCSIWNSPPWMSSETNSTLKASSNGHFDLAIYLVCWVTFGGIAVFLLTQAKRNLALCTNHNSVLHETQRKTFDEVSFQQWKYFCRIPTDKFEGFFKGQQQEDLCCLKRHMMWALSFPWHTKKKFAKRTEAVQDIRVCHLCVLEEGLVVIRGSQKNKNFRRKGTSYARTVESGFKKIPRAHLFCWNLFVFVKNFIGHGNMLSDWVSHTQTRQPISIRTSWETCWGGPRGCPTGPQTCVGEKFWWKPEIAKPSSWRRALFPVSFWCVNEKK